MPTLEKAVQSLKRMQEFDASTLVREEDLGKIKNFHTAVEPANRLIALYKQLSIVSLEDLPDQKLDLVASTANADFQRLDEILKFDADRTTTDRDQVVDALKTRYAPSFDTLHPLIAYSLHRSADFRRLETEARATLQSIRDAGDSLTADLQESQVGAKRILEEIRKTAAETGVSQQAFFFKESAEVHEAEAARWRKYTTRLAVATGIFAILSVFVHKIPFIRPENTYDTVQIAVSKVLLFGVLSFMLYLAAKNFHSHKHNAIVNRHRQQALQTYQALVDAAGDSGQSDIVLTHAASCIFSPQSTGYTTDKGAAPSGAKTVVELLGSSVVKSSSSAQ